MTLCKPLVSCPTASPAFLQGSCSAVGVAAVRNRKRTSRHGLSDHHNHHLRRRISVRVRLHPHKVAVVILVNLFAGPGAGKSTMMASVFAILKGKA